MGSLKPCFSENSFLTSTGASIGKYKCPGSPVRRARKKTITKSPVMANKLDNIRLDKYFLI